MLIEVHQRTFLLGSPRLRFPTGPCDGFGIKDSLWKSRLIALSAVQVGLLNAHDSVLLSNSAW